MSVVFKNKFLKDVHVGICNPGEGNLDKGASDQTYINMASA